MQTFTQQSISVIELCTVLIETREMQLPRNPLHVDNTKLKIESYFCLLLVIAFSMNLHHEDEQFFWNIELIVY